tara:strand:+ start:827 stop:1552 length:726 start_codon:yes stop_codon:yes gene_type:complete
MALTKTQIAANEARTLFQYRVKKADRSLMAKTELLVKKSTNDKLGKKVRKGHYKGYPIYTLTLEERATCPKSCVHWLDCYGNHMRYAYRYEAGPALEAMLETELAELQRKHPKGFLVRLHILGDFYSVSYVAKWASWLGKYPALKVYGYTANQPNASDKLEREIGQAILSLRENANGRFAVRFSGNFEDNFSANSFDDIRSKEAIERKEAILCPEQAGQVNSCADCALCWAADKPIIFETH